MLGIKHISNFSTIMKKLLKVKLPKPSVEFTSALYASILAFAISPFSVLLGFQLNEYLSRAILSIEYISSNPIYKVNGLDSVKYYFQSSPLYNEFKRNSINTGVIDLQYLENYANDFPPEELIDVIKNNILQFQQYLVNEDIATKKRIAKIDNLKPSEVRTAFLFETDANEDENNIENMRIRLKSKLSEKSLLTQQAQNQMLRFSQLLSRDLISVRLKITILNNGSTDGLVRNEGKIILGQDTFVLERTSPPIVRNPTNAVPTFNVNPSNEYSSNSVGRIEKNTMVDFWYGIKIQPNTSCPDICSRGSYKVILYDQKNSPIKTDKKCKS